MKADFIIGVNLYGNDSLTVKQTDIGDDSYFVTVQSRATVCVRWGQRLALSQEIKQVIMICGYGSLTVAKTLIYWKNILFVETNYC